jgi:hypothetical protein
MHRPATAFAACLVFATGVALAQSAPGGAAPAGKPSARMRTPEAFARVEDMVPADPLRLWRERLLQLRPTLTLDAPQAEAYDAFVRELGDMVKLNERRMLRMLAGSGLAVSGIPDVGRDLRYEREEASDEAAAAADVSSRWTELEQRLAPELREAISTAWALSRAQAARGPTPRIRP